MSYCPTVSEPRKKKSTHSKQPSLPIGGSKVSRVCSAIKDPIEQKECRKNKIEKCMRNRKRKGKSANEQPCTAAERKLRSKSRIKAMIMPWETESSCSGLRSRSDRRLCNRYQRRTCQNKLQRRYPQMSKKKVKQNCSKRQWLQTCQDRQKRRAKRLNRQSLVNPRSCKRSWKRREDRRKMRRKD